jgi:hypothetical protein
MVGDNNFKCANLIPNAASSYDRVSLLSSWNMVYTNGLMVYFERILAVYGLNAGRKKVTWVVDPTSSIDAAKKST